MVMESSKLARNIIINCGPRETPLFEDPNQVHLYQEAIKLLFSSFARCLQQLAFSGSEDTFDEDGPVSQLTGSPSNYRIRDSKIHGPVRLINSLKLNFYPKI